MKWYYISIDQGIRISEATLHFFNPNYILEKLLFGPYGIVTLSPSVLKNTLIHF